MPIENIAQKANTTKNYTPAVYRVCIVAALAGLLFGLDLGVIAGVIPFLKMDFHPTTVETEWVVSAVLAGAAIGAVTAGFLTRKYGRKNVLIISVIIFALACLASSLSIGPADLISYRFVLGFSIGLASFTAPIYLSEIAPAEIRGKLVAFYLLMFTVEERVILPQNF